MRQARSSPTELGNGVNTKIYIILARSRLNLVSMSISNIDVTLDLDMLDIVKYIFLILTIQSVFKNH